MKRLMLVFALFLLATTELYAEDVTVDLRFDPTPAALRHSLIGAVKGFKEVKVHTFTDRRAIGETVIGDLMVNGQPQRVKSKIPLAAFATDSFRQTFADWGGRINAQGPLALKGELTQFDFDEVEGYQARIGFHFYLLDEAGKVIWDGHSSGVVRATGKAVSPESFSGIFSDILRTTYAELLEDDKLVSVWSGKFSNTYIIRDEATSKNTAKAGR